MTPLEKKQQYAERKSLGLCVKCGKADARTQTGRVLCLACLEKEDKYKERYAKSKKGKLALKRSRQNYYNKRKALGLCTICGQPLEPKRLGKCYCRACAERRNDSVILTEKDQRLCRAFRLVFQYGK